MPDTRDDEPQRHDKWGGMLQNEYGRVLGRIESNTEQLAKELRDLKSEGKGRDNSLKAIEERVRANAHKAGNDLQILSNRVEGLDGKVVNVGVAVDTANKRMEQQGVQLTSIDGRVAKLEEPVHEGMVIRERRRTKQMRWLRWGLAAVGFLWVGFEPVYKWVMPIALQRWFNLNLPPH